MHQEKAQLSPELQTGCWLWASFYSFPVRRLISNLSPDWSNIWAVQSKCCFVNIIPLPREAAGLPTIPLYWKSEQCCHRNLMSWVLIWRILMWFTFWFHFNRLFHFIYYFFHHLQSNFDPGVHYDNTVISLFFTSIIDHPTCVILASSIFASQFLLGSSSLFSIIY